MPPLCKGRWLSEAKPEGLFYGKTSFFCDKSAKIRNIYPQSNPSVSHTLDSSPYTGEPLKVDFFDTLKRDIRKDVSL